MAEGLDKNHSRLDRAEVRRVLMAHWDPIGIKDEPRAWDEYDIYIEPVCTVLMDDRGSRDRIAAYLHGVATEQMGLASTRSGAESCRITSDTLIRLRQSFESVEP